MSSNCSRGPSGMIVEHLRQWLQEEQKAESEEATVAESGAGKSTKAGAAMEAEITDMDPLDLYHWHNLVKLIQADLREGRLEEDTK